MHTCFNLQTLAICTSVWIQLELISRNARLWSLSAAAEFGGTCTGGTILSLSIASTDLRSIDGARLHCILTTGVGGLNMV